MDDVEWFSRLAGTEVHVQKLIPIPSSVTFEPFVDAERAALFLAMSRKTLLLLARKGYLPGYPVGQGVRKVWKFRLSELDSWMKTAVRSGSDQGRFQERKPFR